MNILSDNGIICHYVMPVKLHLKNQNVKSCKRINTIHDLSKKTGTLCVMFFLSFCM